MEREQIEKFLDDYRSLTGREKATAYSVLASLEGLTTRDATAILNL